MAFAVVAVVIPEVLPPMDKNIFNSPIREQIDVKKNGASARDILKIPPQPPPSLFYFFITI